MEWEDCEKHRVKRIRPNRERARSIKNMAERRLRFIEKIGHDEGVEFIVENYYETIKELITALLFIRGYKSYSHECLVVFLKTFYVGFENIELELIDQMRRIRHDIMYRGDPVASEYLERREEEARYIIKKLLEVLEKELEEELSRNTGGN